MSDKHFKHGLHVCICSPCSPTCWTWTMTSAAPHCPPSRRRSTTPATWRDTRTRASSGGCHVMSCLMCHVTSFVSCYLCHVTSYVSCFLRHFMSRHVMSHLMCNVICVTSCHVMSCLTLCVMLSLSCHILCVMLSICVPSCCPSSECGLFVRLDPGLRGGSAQASRGEYSYKFKRGLKGHEF